MSIAARTSNVIIRPAPPRQAGARGMAASRTGWEAKLRPDLQPEVVIDPRQGGRMLVATPLLVAAEVARVRRGEVVTTGELRLRLARHFCADRTCPASTGIFLAVVAGAVSEDLLRGRKPRWPIWRVVSDDGRLHPNWPLDARWRAAKLREEGRVVGQCDGVWHVRRPDPAGQLSN